MQVFVYGTLKPGGKYYQRYCATAVVAFWPAIARGRLFALPAGYPAMTPGEDWVRGFLLQFRDRQVLPALDAYEDYDCGRSPQENLYDRQQIQVFDLAELPLGSAWAYLMTSEQIQQLGGQWIPTGQWD